MGPGAAGGRATPDLISTVAGIDAAVGRASARAALAIFPRCATFGLAQDRDGLFLRVEWVREALERRQGSRRGRDRTGAVKAFLGVDASWQERARVLAPGYRHVTLWIPLSRGHGEGD